MSSLVEVWSTISQRALTSAIRPATDDSLSQFEFTVALSKKNGQYCISEEATDAGGSSGLCSICKRAVTMKDDAGIQCQTCFRVFHRGGILQR